MRSKIGDKERVNHIYECVLFIEEHTSKITKEEFLANKVLCLAVDKEFEIIGEASNNLSEELRMKYESIEWRRIVAFRNFLVHEYFTVDYNIFWEIIHKDMLQLKKDLEAIIKNEKF
ncbi:MAG: hypothetical protein RL065_767 [Bacteroidota bacterium]|jgi:uncharacterized protein with HEPN domain